MEFLIFKAITTLAVVLSIAWITERRGEKWGAALSGFPNTFGLATLFFGIALGKEFVMEMIPFSLASVFVIMVFCAVWVFALQVNSKLWFAPVLALVAYGLIAPLLSLFSFRIEVGIAIACLSIVFAVWLFDRFPQKPLVRKPLTFFEMAFRVTFVLAIVLIVTESAGFLGAEIAGILAMFPMNLFPLLFILQRRYGGNAVITLVRSFPLRVTSSVVFGLSLYGLLHYFDFLVAWCIAMGFATVTAIAVARLEPWVVQIIGSTNKHRAKQS